MLSEKMYLIYLFYTYVFLMVLTSFFLVMINFVKQKKEKYKKGKYAPKVLVILPCKGYDLELERGIRSLLSQDYKNYDIISVVASKDDTALKSIKKLGLKYILSDNKRFVYASGKVRSLATAFLAYRNDYDVFVVVDSDTICAKSWLGSLISPLYDKNIGIVTTFPLFIPTKKAGIWAYIKTVWGFVGLGLMENKRTRFAWGGSMAFRSSLIDDFALERFGKALSDDIALTRIVKERNLGIAYIPQGLVRIPSNDGMHKFMEWSNRQTALMVLGNKKILNYGIYFYTMNIILLVSSIVIGILYNAAMFLLLLPFAIGIIKSYKRSKLLDLRIAIASLVINFIYLLNLLNARSAKTITWRGITYKLEQD
ncbi:MAG: glycosyltransferase family 2 protein [Candidatus Marsarchaeota archaeon]|nr:glycosyltransferase family 2 protein [Candidatus Marsarchaeota archaeon]